ncbi:hypothetical protein [Autumnicola psychrophila]|uniref:Fatty acid desaturase domain-containing protein n=1 Tax=Autumnicola psychrophila TaxID=3075592 RepID=A0ABU3DVQ6_9FLAO|nr:hypothetical protein [Zunongwangia sp. F225]MDT0687818.1 hypothetical protein [Zunongwangia sp. F225]
MIGHLPIGEPHEVNNLTHGFLSSGWNRSCQDKYKHHLQHHLWIVAGWPIFTISFDQWLNVELFNHSTDDFNRVIPRESILQ